MNDDENDSGDEGSNILADGGIDTDERAGRSLGIEPDAEPDDETKKEMEEEREKRLDPENRPENAEVDNTPRDFDVERGLFKDSEDYDEGEPAPFKDPEDPNSSDNADTADTPDDQSSSSGEDGSDADDSDKAASDESAS